MNVVPCSPLAPVRAILEGHPMTEDIRRAMVARIPALLVDGFGIAEPEARAVADAVYDDYADVFGQPPPDISFLHMALANRNGRARLTRILADTTALVAAPQPAARVVEPVPVADTSAVAAPAAVKPAPPVTQPAPMPVMMLPAVPVPGAGAGKSVDRHGNLISNDKLTLSEERILRTELEAAVKAGGEKLDATLRRLAAQCKDAGQDYFVTQFGNWTAVSGLLIRRLKVLGLSFGLYWTEGGKGDLPPRPSSLPAAEAKRLTLLLRKAVRNSARAMALPHNKLRDDSYRLLDTALADIVQVCRQHGQTTFVTPYAPQTRLSGLLIGRLMQGGHKFRLAWTDGGPDGET